MCGKRLDKSSLAAALSVLGRRDGSVGYRMLRSETKVQQYPEFGDAMTLRDLLLGCVLTSAVLSVSHAAEDGTFAAQSNLKAGVAKVDITPDVTAGLPIVGHRRTVFEIRDPLRAGVLVLDDGDTKVAIVTLDTIGAWDEMVQLARERIEKLTSIPAANIMVTASHNHSGPGFDAESAWGRSLIEKLGTAAKNAAATMRPVTVGYGEDRIGFGINRRKVIDGRAVVRLNPEGLNDQRVKVLRFDDGTSLTPLAVVMHAVCHPCFFTWGRSRTRTVIRNSAPTFRARLSRSSRCVTAEKRARCFCRAVPATSDRTCQAIHIDAPTKQTFNGQGGTLAVPSSDRLLGKSLANVW
jgi:hypothetical protein